MAMCKMAKNETVLLGYEDEPIKEKHSSLVGYWTNKIGGKPDWPLEGVPLPNCKLCALPQLLVTQIYAPLEGSPYHRTLYLFCCINPNCWNHSDSWTCRRSQLLDVENHENMQQKTPEQVKREWCVGADDWDDDNGNTLSVLGPTATDSDDSSSLSTTLGNMRVDQCNANWGAGKGFGAVGKVTATAEIEGDEGEVVTIDTPTAPQYDLIALLEATAPLPSLKTSLSFVPSFISVEEEGGFVEISEHVRKLLAEYQACHGEVCQPATSLELRSSGEEDERYEKALPAHGDAMFYEFLTRIQANPGHILRYCRNSIPLLIATLNDAPHSCCYCQGELVFELQLLPTLLNKLVLPGDPETHVDFGNVLVFTCKNSCWSADDVFRDETIRVQAEVVSPRTS